MSDPAKYRSKEEVKEYKDRDPIEYVRGKILDNKWASEEDLKAIDDKIKAEVLECVKFEKSLHILILLKHLRMFMFKEIILL